jgi:hypothetical protein
MPKIVSQQCSSGIRNRLTGLSTKKHSRKENAPTIIISPCSCLTVPHTASMFARFTPHSIPKAKEMQKHTAAGIRQWSPT